MTCPSILELTTLPLSDTTHEHVAGCLRCQALLAAWEADTTEDGPQFGAVDVEIPCWTPRADPRAEVQIGAVHTVGLSDRDVFLLGLVVDYDETQATVMPLSDEVRWAADWDVLLDEDVLGYFVMVEAWNPIDVLVEQLAEQLAVVERAGRFVELYDRSLSGDAAPENLCDGPPIDSDDDLRLLFRDHERERVRPYGEPARVINMGESLGQVLQGVRDERGRTAEDLASAAGLEVAVLQRLEDDREDLRARVSIKQFKALVAQLDLPVSDAFLGYVEEAACRNDREGVDQQAVVHARRRRHTRLRQPQAPEAERRERAKAWVAKLRRELMEEQ
jgi:transcriptional regulator with XRE-family HTH domain